jgi:hypothetical protein
LKNQFSKQGAAGLKLGIPLIHINSRLFFLAALSRFLHLNFTVVFVVVNVRNKEEKKKLHHSTTFKKKNASLNHYFSSFQTERLAQAPLSL